MQVCNLDYHINVFSQKLRHRIALDDCLGVRSMLRGEAANKAAGKAANRIAGSL